MLRDLEKSSGRVLRPVPRLHIAVFALCFATSRRRPGRLFLSRDVPARGRLTFRQRDRKMIAKECANAPASCHLTGGAFVAAAASSREQPARRPAAADRARRDRKNQVAGRGPACDPDRPAGAPQDGGSGPGWPNAPAQAGQLQSVSAGGAVPVQGRAASRFARSVEVG